MSDVTKLRVRIGGASQAPELTIRGRQAWALDQLLSAGDSGCTPLTHPGPRWSDYVFKLRRDGFTVETIDERHGGPYRGSHARYVLRSPVEVIAREVRS